MVLGADINGRSHEWCETCGFLLKSPILSTVFHCKRSKFDGFMIDLWLWWWIYDYHYGSMMDLWLWLWIYDRFMMDLWLLLWIHWSRRQWAAVLSRLLTRSVGQGVCCSSNYLDYLDLIIWIIWIFFGSLLLHFGLTFCSADSFGPFWTKFARFLPDFLLEYPSRRTIPTQSSTQASSRNTGSPPLVRFNAF